MKHLPHFAALFAALVFSASANAAPSADRVAAYDLGYLPGDLPLRPVPPRAHEPTGPQRVPLVRRVLHDADQGPVVARGALSGVTVYLSPGHGYTYTSASGWDTQRPTTFGLVEDFSNVDGVAQFLVPYLWGAGAQVVPVRELDPQSEMVVVDNDDGARHPSRGVYKESGNLAVISTSSIKAWGQPTLPMTGTTNPFQLGTNRLMATSATETARATFVPKVPASGFYYVYVSYSMYAKRPSDARFMVTHAGGTTTYLVNQKRHGGTWVLLGRHYFVKGADAQQGAVVVSNRSSEPKTWVSVDAVRLGGGKGLMDRGGGVSGVARQDECSRYYAKFAGAPPGVYNVSTGSDRIDDVGARSRFADWVHAAGEPAIYFSHHSNAFHGNTRGTSSYVYGTNPPNGAYTPGATTLALGSDKLAKAVQNMVVADLRAGVDATWRDRKVRSAYFGELNTHNQDEMAAMLMETAFHDNALDAAELKKSSFRKIITRAMVKGIIKYFADKAGKTPTYPPATPVSVRVVVTGPGKARMSWSAGPFAGQYGGKATGFRVYRGTLGPAFDNGTDTRGKTTLSLTGLPRDRVTYLRVTATNAGGESLPSPTLAVLPRALGGRARVLLVTAFDRLDAGINVLRSFPKRGRVNRLYLDRINSGAYLVDHARALSGRPVVLESGTRDAVIAGVLKPDAYPMVVWQGGQGNAGNKPMTETEARALTAAAARGATLLLSGSQLGRTLSKAGPVARALLSTTMGASYLGVGAVPARVTPTSGGFLAGVAAFSLGTDTTGPYEVREPEKLGGSAAAGYAAGGTAMVMHRVGGRCRVLMGFPFESVTSDAAKAAIFAKLFASCGVGVIKPGDGGPMTPDLGQWDAGWQDAGPSPTDGAPPATDRGVDAGYPYPLVLVGGCHVGTSHGGGLLLPLVLGLLLARVRRRRSSGPGPGGAR